MHAEAPHGPGISLNRGGSRVYQHDKHDSCTPVRETGRDLRANHPEGWIRKGTGTPQMRPPGGSLLGRCEMGVHVSEHHRVTSLMRNSPPHLGPP